MGKGNASTSNDDSTVDESVMLDIRDNTNTSSNKLPFTVLNTNARSLCPKMSSLIDCFSEMEASLGIVTETWLSDGDGLEEETESLVLGTGLNMLYRNRKVNNKGFLHGGVAILYRESVSYTHLTLPTIYSV